MAARANKIEQERLEEARLALGEAANEPEGWHWALKKLRRAGKGGDVLKVGCSVSNVLFGWQLWHSF